MLPAPMTATERGFAEKLVVDVLISKLRLPAKARVQRGGQITKLARRRIQPAPEILALMIPSPTAGAPHRRHFVFNLLPAPRAKRRAFTSAKLLHTHEPLGGKKRAGAAHHDFIAVA